MLVATKKIGKNEPLFPPLPGKRFTIPAGTPVTIQMSREISGKPNGHTTRIPLGFNSYHEMVGGYLVFLEQNYLIQVPKLCVVVNE